MIPDIPSELTKRDMVNLERGIRFHLDVYPPRMQYSSFQTLFVLLHVRGIPLKIDAVPDQGFVFTIGPHPSIKDISTCAIVNAGNSYNDFYTIAVLHHTIGDENRYLITVQTGVLTIELVSRMLLEYMVPDLNTREDMLVSQLYEDPGGTDNPIAGYRLPSLEDYLNLMLSEVKHQSLATISAYWANTQSIIGPIVEFIKKGNAD